MGFDSLQYGLFLGLVVLLSRLPLLSRRGWLPLFCLVCSGVFYAWAGWLALGIFALSILANYGLARLLQAWRSPRRVWVFALGVAFNLSYLFAFKYAGLIQSSWGSLARAWGWQKAPLVPVEVLLPVGISFYTFEALSFLVDGYQDRYPVPRLCDFALFVSFFPHLVAGPILRGKDFFPQVARLKKEGARIDWARGRDFLVLGFFKKLVLADSLALFSDPIFSQPSAYAPLKLWLAVYAFAFQIYFDFSGYSDIAEGSAALLGLRLAQNFRSPYSATSLTDFWRRWHLSLSTWLRDYVYIPLGGSRQGASRALLALFATMTLGGLWHGARWTFALWGIFHGALLVAERMLGWNRAQPGSVAGLFWRRALTFHLVLLGWVLFRCDSLMACRSYLHALGGRPFAWDGDEGGILLLLAAGAFFSRWEGAWVEAAWSDAPRRLEDLSLALLAALAIIFGAAQAGVVQPFIYFRF